MISITLGELYDALEAIKNAEQSLKDAEYSLSHGGREDTVARKQGYVNQAERMLKSLRDQVVMNVTIVDSDLT